ncbi:MAG: DUF3613 domain-containing protein [Janthinobacterium lividum]
MNWSSTKSRRHLQLAEMRASSMPSGSVGIVIAMTIALTASPALAQAQQPLTGQVMDGQSPSAARASAKMPTSSVAAALPSPPSAPIPVADRQSIAPQPSALNERQVGDVTTLLLTAQADGSVAAPRLPMLGATASAAYKRYLDSFSHPIPEYFQEKIHDQSSGSGSGSGS